MRAPRRNYMATSLGDMVEAQIGKDSFVSWRSGSRGRSTRRDKRYPAANRARGGRHCLLGACHRGIDRWQDQGSARQAKGRRNSLEPYLLFWVCCSTSRLLSNVLTRRGQTRRQRPNPKVINRSSIASKSSASGRGLKPFYASLRISTPTSFTVYSRPRKLFSPFTWSSFCKPPRGATDQITRQMAALACRWLVGSMWYRSRCIGLEAPELDF